jgi:glycosyltransferase involved in cell wall biosynthesis
MSSPFSESSTASAKVSAGTVSVITPFFNAARYLPEAIASVLAQDYRPLELLLVDDGSTDGHTDAIARIADRSEHVHLLRLPSNQGPAAARNVGLRQACGEFLTFLDADDLMLPDRLSFQTDYLRSHPGIDIVVGVAENVVEPGVRPPRWWQRAGHRYRYSMTMLGRRSVFDRVGAFDASYRVAEDMEWMFRAVAAGVVVAKVDRVLIRRRIHGANLTYRTKEMRAATHRIVLRLARDRISEHRLRR